MKKILIGLCVLISVNVFGQVPGYTKINARYNWTAGIFDTSLHVPRYNGTPSGLRVGAYIADGAVAVDTLNHRWYFYSGGAWVRGANYSEIGSTYTFSNGLTESGGTVKLGGTLVNNTTVDIDGNNLTIVDVGFSRMSITPGTTSFYSPTEQSFLDLTDVTAAITGKDSVVIKQISNGNIRMRNLNYTLSTTGKKIMLRDTATGLVQNIDASLIGSTNIYNSNGTLTGNRILDGGGYSLSFDNVNKFKVGLSTTASGNYSTAFGFGTTASNSYSTAFGSSGTASGIYSTAMGLEGTASGHSSTVMGRYNKSKSFAGTVIGTFNDSTDATSPTTFNTANRAFEIGIGTSDAARANAMTVLFNGNVGIGTSTPSRLLHVTGKSLFTDSLRYSLGATNGYVLTSDASGNATWQAASGGGLTGTIGNRQVAFGAGSSIAGTDSVKWAAGKLTLTGDINIYNGSMIDLGNNTDYNLRLRTRVPFADGVGINVTNLTTHDFKLQPYGFELYSVGGSVTVVNNYGKLGINTLSADSTLTVSGSARVSTNLKVNGNIGVDGRLKQTQGADVASAAGAITLGTDGNTFEITGTAAITLISNAGWVNGSEINLIFTSTATLTDGTANSGTDIGMELEGNANFVATADDMVTLVLCEIGGTQRWRMKSKSIN